MDNNYPDAQFIRKRIEDLCSDRNVAMHKMSIDMGHARTYVHKITTGHSMPSVSELLYICQYLKITPEEFFRVDTEPVPIAKQEVIEDILSLPVDDVLTLKPIIERLKKK